MYWNIKRTQGRCVASDMRDIVQRPLSARRVCIQTWCGCDIPAKRCTSSSQNGCHALATWIPCMPRSMMVYWWRCLSNPLENLRSLPTENYYQYYSWRRIWPGNCFHSRFCRNIALNSYWGLWVNQVRWELLWRCRRRTEEIRPGIDPLLVL